MAKVYNQAAGLKGGLTEDLKKYQREFVESLRTKTT
jgi:hypothetical protein